MIIGGNVSCPTPTQPQPPEVAKVSPEFCASFADLSIEKAPGTSYAMTVNAPKYLLDGVRDQLCKVWNRKGYCKDSKVKSFCPKVCGEGMNASQKGACSATGSRAKVLPYNSTHVDENPKNNPGKHVNDRPDGDGILANCLTQTSIINNKGEKKTNYHTCTSCKPGTVFQMIYAKSRAGNCQKPTMNPAVSCTNAEKDSWDVSWHKNDQIMCTKYAMFHSKVKVRSSGGKAKVHFHPVTKMNKGFTSGLALARCQGWKTVSCNKGKCAVKKEVNCIDVCRYQPDKYNNGNSIGNCKVSQDRALRAVREFESHMQNLKMMGHHVNRTVHDAAWRYKQELKKPKTGCTPLCYKSLCKAPYGELACKGSIITL